VLSALGNAEVDQVLPHAEAPEVFDQDGPRGLVAPIRVLAVAGEQAASRSGVEAAAGSCVLVSGPA